MDYDPYQASANLARMSVDIGSDMVSLTTTDISAALLQASRIIEDLADEYNHWRTRNRVMIIANGEEIELESGLVDALIGESISRMVTEAIEMYVTASKVLPELKSN
jgi:NAD(P)H-hydrate repair Nnr-like enzyme with NAD(P)H-hydrate epimerase domain